MQPCSQKRWDVQLWTVLAHISSFRWLLQSASLLSFQSAPLLRAQLILLCLYCSCPHPDVLLALSPPFLSPMVLIEELSQPDVLYSQSLSYLGFKTQVLYMIKKSQGRRADFKREGDEETSGREGVREGGRTEHLMMTIHLLSCVYSLAALMLLAINVKK